MRAYCTYFDQAYVDRGLTLIASIRRHDPDASLHVLTLGPGTRSQVEAFDPALHIWSLEDLEARDPQLARARPGTPWREFLSMLRPSFLLEVLGSCPPDLRLTYMDADMWQLAPPGASLDQLAEAAVLLTPHDLPEDLAHLRAYGAFNAGWVAARNDADGRAVLEDWRRRCLEGCPLDIDRGRAGNQTHLDPLFEAGLSVAATRYPGVNVGPWNLRTRDLERHPGGAWTAAGRRLVSVHLHGLVPGGAGRYYPQLWRYGVRLADSPVRHLYRAYVERLSEVRRWLSARGWRPPVGAPDLPARDPSAGALGRARFAARSAWRLARTHLRRDLLVVGGLGH